MGRKARTRWGALAWPGICRATAAALTDEARLYAALSMRAEARVQTFEGCAHRLNNGNETGFSEQSGRFANCD